MHLVLFSSTKSHQDLETKDPSRARRGKNDGFPKWLVVTSKLNTCCIIFLAIEMPWVGSLVPRGRDLFSSSFRERKQQTVRCCDGLMVGCYCTYVCCVRTVHTWRHALALPMRLPVLFFAIRKSVRSSPHRYIPRLKLDPAPEISKARIAPRLSPSIAIHSVVEES